MNNIQVPPTHYTNDHYDHKARWISYWQQIRDVISVKPKNALEVGLGNGLTASYLKTRDIDVKTLDIDESLRPDYAASVLSMPINENSFDVVFAFEVLEHLPFDKFSEALKEMSRVTRKFLIISLPDSRHTLIHFLLKLPFLPRIEIFYKINSIKKHVFDGQHYWEIGKLEYPLSRIRRIIQKSNLRIVKDYVTPDCPTKHFFVVKKTM